VLEVVAEEHLGVLLVDPVGPAAVATGLAPQQDQFRALLTLEAVAVVAETVRLVQTAAPAS
jgi:hypothetical protein